MHANDVSQEGKILIWLYQAILWNRYQNDIEFLIDNIFVMFGGGVFQQTVGIPMGTNCALLLTDLILYSHEEYFIQGLLKKSEKKLSRFFKCTFRYIDNVLSVKKQFQVMWFCWSHLSHNTTGVTGTATPPQHLSSPEVFSGVHVARSLIFCVVFCRSLFVQLSFFPSDSCMLCPWCTASDYHSGVFRLLLYLWQLITVYRRFY